MSNILRKFALNLKLKLIQELIIQDHNALKILDKSITTTIIGDEIQVKAVKYALVVNQGRQAGTVPNVAAIAKWLVAKGIVKQNEAKKVAWAVALSIKDRGTRVAYNGVSKRGFIDKALEKSRVEMAKAYGEHFREEVKIKLKRMISSNGKTIDIKL